MFRLRKACFVLLSVSLVALATGCFSDASATAASREAARIREPNACVTAEDGERMADQVLQLINLERAAANKNLSPVVRNDKLTHVADEYACRMIELDFFDHYDLLTGRGPADRAVAGKYSFYAIGENLAAGPETAAEAMKLWMESPAHRQIILDPNWTEVGVGVRAGGEYSIYWVQLFGDPASGL